MKSKDIIVKFIRRRIERNKNCIIIINGGTGSGKSYAGLRVACDIAEELGTNFSVKQNVDFKFNRLLEKMMYIEGNDKPGTVFLFEEVGAVGGGGSAHEWQSQANKFFDSFMQTNRCKRQVLIMTCPDFANLNARTRKLCHMQWEMNGIDERKKVSYVKPFLIQVNLRSGKMYFKYIRATTQGGRQKVNRLILELPPKDIIREYEESKNFYVNTLNENILEESKPKLKKERKTEIDLVDVKKKFELGLKPRELASMFNVTERSIYNYLKKINNKSNIVMPS